MEEPDVSLKNEIPSFLRRVTSFSYVHKCRISNTLAPLLTSVSLDFNIRDRNEGSKRQKTSEDFILTDTQPDTRITKMRTSARRILDIRQKI
jgi:hypothetical protein